MKVIAILAALAFGAAPALAQRVAATSAYTDLDLDGCAILSEIEEGASAAWRCPGYRGVPLIVLSGDDRFDVDAGVDNEVFESQRSFSSPPRRVEWRLRAGRPFAIIYRLTLNDEEGPIGSVLVVETVGRPGAPGCEVALVHASVRSANAVARRHADRRAPAFRCGQDHAEYDGPAF